MRFAYGFGLVITMVGMGAAGGLFLVENVRWVQVSVPSWLTGWFGGPLVEMWLPGMLAGWILAVVLSVALVLVTAFAVWRRRQSEALIRRLERELASLRNLPFTQPAPFEDLPEDEAEEAAF